MQNEMRDRLAEIIRNAQMNANPLTQVGYAEADALIDHGVTVQEWISVKDRRPESSGFVLTAFNNKTLSVLHYSAKNKAFNSFDSFDNHDADLFPTHWMPLPQPPKGEIK